MSEPRMYSLEEALKVQKALRSMTGLGPELFPVEAFVGMISDEIEELRKSGKSEEDIAQIIRAHNDLDITAAKITKYHAPPEVRHQ